MRGRAGLRCVAGARSIILLCVMRTWPCVVVAIVFCPCAASTPGCLSDVVAGCATHAGTSFTTSWSQPQASAH